MISVFTMNVFYFQMKIDTLESLTRKTTSYGTIFRRLFGTEKNKGILLAFLNSVFEGIHEPIADLSFIPTHQTPSIAILRESVVDVLCRSTDDREFILEMQCACDNVFIQRASTPVKPIAVKISLMVMLACVPSSSSPS
jgi:hypothetical protein